jgi:hypothetical protein
MSALHDHPLLVSTRFGRRHANRVAAWLASSRQTAISYGMYAPAVEAALSAAADAMLRQAVEMMDPPAARAAAEFLDRLVG